MRQSSGAEKAHKHAETRASSSISSSLKGLVTVAALMTAAMLWLGRSLFHSFSGAQLGILAGLVVGGAIIFGVAFFAGVLLPRWQRDSLRLEEALRRVASGDLSRVEAPELSEYSRGVSDSFAAAVSRVRDEVAELREISRDQSARAQELSAHCSGFASTSIKLLEQSTTAVHHGQELAEATERARGEVLQLAQAGTLASQDAVALHVRHDEAAELTRDSLTRLDATVELLGSLSGRVEAGSKELSALAAAVAEIRTFVAQVRKMARQSKLLALNAAMEAARAGEQGTGFAVVAGEVRRLASSSTEAAERADAQTSDLVRRSTELLASSESAMMEVRQALEATARGRASLQLLAEGTLARQEDGRSTMDPAALGALVSATLEDVVRGARAALEAMQEVDGGVHAHRDRAQGVAAAGIALGRRSAIEPFNAAKQPGKDRASLARTAASEPRTGAAVEPALSTS